MSISVSMRKYGRIVVPEAYRKLYNLKEGDIVELEILRVKHPDGTVIELFEKPKEAKEHA